MDHRRITTNKESSRPTFSKPLWKKYFVMKKRIKKFSKPHNKSNNKYYPRKHFPRKQTTNKESSRPTIFKHIQKNYFLKKKLSSTIIKPIIFFVYQKILSTKTNNSSRSMFSNHVQKNYFHKNKKKFSNPHNNSKIIFLSQTTFSRKTDNQQRIIKTNIFQTRLAKLFRKRKEKEKKFSKNPFQKNKERRTEEKEESVLKLTWFISNGRSRRSEKLACGTMKQHRLVC